MKKLKYQTKFLLYHAGVMLLIILGLVGYFYRVVVEEMKAKEERDFRIITEKTATQLDSLFYNMDKVALQIAANPEIVLMFQSLPNNIEDNYFTSHPFEKGTVKKLLGSYNFKKDGHSRICLYNRFGDFVATSNRAITEQGIGKFFSGGDFHEVREFFQQDDRYIYHRPPGADVLAAGEAQQKDYVAIVREIKDYYSSSSRWGYIEVQESTQKLEEILTDIGVGIQVKLMSPDNISVYETKEKINLKSKAVYKVEVPLENAPYTAVFYKDPIELNRAINRFYGVLAVTVATIMFLGVLLERILVKLLSKPLVNLTQSLNSVTIDNLRVEIADEDSTDIVLSLETSFNTMLEKLNDTMQNQITAKTNEVKSHLFALQSQMNPHFLHNILAIISMESQMGDVAKVPEICRMLGEILRYNSEMGDGYSTVDKECKIAENYMLLMKVRYEELFEYKIKIEESVRDIRIPKLIIQPLCENCFQHGLKNVDTTWEISVRSWSEKSKWYIAIEDNGSGFTNLFLNEFETLKEDLQQSDAKSVLENISIGGLCLPNIYTRMKITYGSSFVFEINNTANGAIVLLGGEIDDKSISCRR